MATQVIPAWVPTIIKGEVFSKEFAFTDVNDAPIAYTDFVITVTSFSGMLLETWSVGSGNVTFISTGVYDLDLTVVETTAITWSEATYKLSVTDPDGNPIPCLIENLIFARSC